MAEKLTREATFPEEMEELVSSISQIRIQNLRSDLFQQQNIASPYTLVMERFCAEKKTGDVEILDGKSVFPLTLTRQQYQYLIDRPLHSHNYLEIMIVLSGAVLNRFGEESYTCSAGQGYIMNTNIRHKEEPIGDAEILFVGMKREFLLDLLSIMQTENTTLPNPALNDFFRSVADSTDTFKSQHWDFSPTINEQSIHRVLDPLYKSAVDAVRKNRPGSSYLIRAAILRFLADLCDPALFSLRSVSSALEHKAFLVSKVDFLIQASHGRISKKEMEDHLSYNGDYLNRLFKQVKGISISKSCREVMIWEAQTLLRNTDFSVDEIMDRLQVKSRGYFFSAFRESTGMTPCAYRK